MSLGLKVYVNSKKTTRTIDSKDSSFLQSVVSSVTKKKKKKKRQHYLFPSSWLTQNVVKFRENIITLDIL